VPRNNHLTPQGDAAYSAGGRHGGAVVLDGMGDMLDRATFPTEVPTGNESYTLAAWIKPDQGGARGIIAYGNYGSGRQVNALRLDNTNSLINYWWGADLVADNTDVSNQGINLLDGEWHHVSAVYDQLAGTRDLYIDGIRVDGDLPGTNGAMPLNFAIGRSCTICGGEFYDGAIDDVVVFDTPLTPDQIGLVMTGDFRSFGGPAIPEPSTVVLAGMALVGFGWRSWRNRRRG
jgi:hypothetical protein